jgi:hypothetical protein
VLHLAKAEWMACGEAARSEVPRPGHALFERHRTALIRSSGSNAADGAHAWQHQIEVIK